MKFLEHRIPPPIVLSFSLVLMWLITMLDSSNFINFEYSRVLSTVVAALGFLVALIGIWGFRKSRTTVNPLDPSSASTLVTSGIYTLSRNPMYLGMLLVTIAWCLYLGSVWSISGGMFFVLYINRFQIIPEERAMQRLFGDEFSEYCKRTRRWL